LGSSYLNIVKSSVMLGKCRGVLGRNSA
jgi:hypothetical protein